MRQVFFCLLLGCIAGPLAAGDVELIRLGENTINEGVLGKEADWIFGDYVLRNDEIVAVIAAPVPGRNANMTVRGVGGCIIDLTRRQTPNDQLSAYYPAGGRYLFEDAANMQVSIDGGELKQATERVHGKTIAVRLRSSMSVAGDQSSCEVTYRLMEKSAAIDVEVRLLDEKGKPTAGPEFDGIRADRTFAFATEKGYATLADEFFRQAYAVAAQGCAFEWSKDRMRRLTYKPSDEDKTTGSWSVAIYPGTSLLDLRHAVVSSQSVAREVQFHLADDRGGVGRAVVSLRGSADGEVLGTARADDRGIATIRLAEGVWHAEVSALGYPAVQQEVTVGAGTGRVDIAMPAAARVHVVATDDAGKSIPCKATIYGAAGFQNPDFGPDSAAGAVGHCVYTASGDVVQPIAPGIYDVYVSYGPEYDAFHRTIQVYAGQETEVRAALKRSVDTSGWVSAELHSHSTPSGDNTSEQMGRVLNLLCEHLEFCPCTEHNRIDTYAPHLSELKSSHRMATCTGMELTGSDLPVNHQNAFPLHHHPHTQDGGAPLTDTDPAAQIERLAMWDGASEKVVQGNHPDLRRIYREIDKDGNAISGLRRMLGFMDVVEVHPPAGLFAGPDADNSSGDPPNRIVRWMQLLNLGHRIPGVVNTDAHYNVHGSGWLRNWFQSTHDDPAEIDLAEMIHSAEHGHIVMSTGPFLQVHATSEHEGDEMEAIPGDDLIADRGRVELDIRVQCPNWFDVDRVQVFVNGQPEPELNFTRASHPKMFSDETVKFEQSVQLTLESDAHVIVATIGESKVLGPVMGTTNGKLQPVAVANPVFVDIDGDGFTPSKDDLGVGLLDEPK